MKKRVKTVSNPNPRALTHEMLISIKDHIKSGQPLVSRHSDYLLLKSHKIRKNTYLSWLKRGAVPFDTPYGMSLHEAVAKARQWIYLNRFKSDIKAGNTDRVKEIFSLDTMTVLSYRRQTSATSMIETWLEQPVDPKIVHLKWMATEKVLSAALT